MQVTLLRQPIQDHKSRWDADWQGNVESLATLNTRTARAKLAPSGTSVAHMWGADRPEG
jgi:hypothetical protein